MQRKPSLAGEKPIVRGKVKEALPRSLPRLSPLQSRLWDAYALYRQALGVPPIISPDVMVVLNEMEEWGIDEHIFQRVCCKLARHGILVSLRELWERLDAYSSLQEVYGFDSVETG